MTTLLSVSGQPHGRFQSRAIDTNGSSSGHEQPPQPKSVRSNPGRRISRPPRDHLPIVERRRELGGLDRRILSACQQLQHVHLEQKR